MRRSTRLRFLPVIIALAVALEGCATIRTMPSLSTPEHPKVYSGARLDFHAIAQKEGGLKKFNAEPPMHPLLDFPFSLILDPVILPATLPMATYEALFE